MDHGRIARENFESGMNCAQSVYCAFCDVTGMTREQALLLSGGFGAGIGRLRETCGAMSGAVMVIGLRYGYADLSDASLKAELYRKVQQYAARFKAATGSLACHELLGLSVWPDEPTPEARTRQYYEKRPCPEICEKAAAVLDALMAEWDTQK